MWIHSRISENTSVSFRPGPIILGALFFICIIGGTVEALVEGPWQTVAIFGGGFAVMFALYAYATHRTHGVWPWQQLPLATYEDDEN